MVSREDREAIAGMHNFASSEGPKHYRDASNGIAGPSTPGKWTKNPTAIHVPSNKPPPQPQSQSQFQSQPQPRGPAKQPMTKTPYNKMRMGNPTAQAKYLPEERPAKKQRTSQAPALKQQPLLVPGKGTPRDQLLIPKRQTPPSLPTEVIDLDSEDADRKQGNEHSADELNIISNEDFVVTRYKPLSPARGIVKDGDATSSLELEFMERQKATSEPSSSSIDAFSSPEPEPQPRIPECKAGTVRERLKMFEYVPTLEERGPNLNLAQIVSTKPSMKNGMKGKNPLVQQARNQQAQIKKFDDPLSLPSLGPKAKSKPSGRISHLPLKRLTIANENKSEHWSVWWSPESRGPNLAFAPSAPSDFQFNVESHIKSAKYLTRDSVNNHSELTMQLSTKKARGETKIKQFGKLKLGDSRAGSITLSFKRDHFEWNDGLYDEFVVFIRQRVQELEILRETAESAIWEMEERKLEAAEALEREGRGRLNQPGPHAGSLGDSLDDDDDSIPVEQTPVTSRFFERPSSATVSSTRAIPNLAINGSTTATIRRSNRQREVTLQGTAKKKDKSPSVDLEEVILCFPRGVPGAVNITFGDVKRLEPGEFLNDTLIEFGLKLWLSKLEQQDSELANQIHVFSSFFYKKLDNKDVDEGYESVRKWTSKIDIFSKKYIIVPINENLHWYLLVIYHPEHVLKPPLPQPDKAIQDSPSVRTRRKAQETERVAEIIVDEDSSQNQDTEQRVDSILEIPEADLLADGHLQTTVDSAASAQEPTTATPTICDLPIAPTCSRSPSQSPEDSIKNGGSSEIDEVNDLLTTDVGSCSITGITGCSVSVTHSYSPTPSLTRPCAPDITADVSAPMEVDREVFSKLEHKPLFSPTASEWGMVLTSCPPSPMEDVQVMSEKASGIPPEVFYGNAKPDPKSKSARVYGAQAVGWAPNDIIIPPEDEGNGQEEDDNDPAPASDEMTYIFTFDSLGSNHPKAINRLTMYLKKEARHRKGVSAPREPMGRKALVPAQPNYCDCGIYLLHFAQTFVSVPDFYRDLILASKGKRIMKGEREEQWQHDKVGHLRERLKWEIMKLSREWKAARDELRKKEEIEKMTIVEESSDDEVDIVNHTPAPVADKKARKAAKGKAAKTTPLRTKK